METTRNASMITRNEVRDYCTSKRYVNNGDNVYVIPKNHIYGNEENNPRTEYGDIETLAEDIRTNGQHKPLIAFVYKTPHGVCIDLADGYRRFRAIEPGSDVKVQLIREIPTLERRLEIAYRSQDNKRLTPMEAGNIFRHFAEAGMPVNEIAVKFGVSRMHVDEMIRLSMEPEDIKQAIATGAITPTAAVELSKKVKDADERKAIVRGAVETGTKIKVKDVKNIADTPANDALPTSPVPSTDSPQQTISGNEATQGTKEDNSGTQDKNHVIVVRYYKLIAAVKVCGNLRSAQKEAEAWRDLDGYHVGIFNQELFINTLFRIK